MTDRTAEAGFPIPAFVTDRPWHNWGRSVSCVPALTFAAQSEEEVVAAVRTAIERGLSIRPVGGSHSWSGLCATGGALIDVTGLTGVRVTDRQRRRVAVKAGTTIFELGQALWEQGLSLPNQGDIDVQTIAGAISTGTHGSGRTLTNLSDCVRSVRLVNGCGELVDVSEQDTTALRAARVCLGLLGVFVEIELEVVESYYLEEQVTYPQWSELLHDWDSNLSAHHSSWFWLPGEDSAGLYQLPVPEGEPMTDRALLRQINRSPGPASPGSANRRVDRNYLVYHGSFQGRWQESEIFVPADDAREALQRIREIAQRRGERFPVQPRWVKGDEAFLSPAYGGDVVGVSISGTEDTDCHEYFQAVYRALDPFGPRMHWGKVYALDRSAIMRAYPEYEAFQRVRRAFDPGDVFLNDHLRELFA